MLATYYLHKGEDWPSQWNLLVLGSKVTFLGFGEVPNLSIKPEGKEDRTQWVGHGEDQSGTHATLSLRSSSSHIGHTSTCPHTGLRGLLLSVVLVRGH